MGRRALGLSPRRKDFLRPDSVPKEGEIEAFDAGWNAHYEGLARETVKVLAIADVHGWALLAWDTRQLISTRRAK